jgi:hypothetical protein
MSIPEFLAAINGIAQLWAADRQFLGVLSSDRYDPNSISNLHGMYGSAYGLYSIRNQHGIYGGAYGLYSPYNTHCLNPPFVLHQGQAVLVVLKNAHFQTNGVPVIDPDFLLDIYAQFSNSPNSVYSAPIERVYQNTEHTQQALNNTVVNPTTIILEPEQSPPIHAQDHFVRAEVYSYPTIFIPDGVGILLKQGRTPEDTYLPSADGVDRGISVEVNCKTGEGLITGQHSNYIFTQTQHQPFNYIQSPSDPYAIAISFACQHYLSKGI